MILSNIHLPMPSLCKKNHVYSSYILKSYYCDCKTSFMVANNLALLITAEAVCARMHSALLMPKNHFLKGQHCKPLNI